jgi:hypothetical protein
MERAIRYAPINREERARRKIMDKKTYDAAKIADRGFGILSVQDAHFPKSSCSMELPIIILYLRDEIKMYERALAKDTNPLGWSFSVEPLEGDAQAIWKSPRFNKIRGLTIRDEYWLCFWNTDYPIEGVTTAAKEKEWVEEQFRGYSMALWRSFNELSLEEKTAIFPERIIPIGSIVHKGLLEWLREKNRDQDEKNVLFPFSQWLQDDLSRERVAEFKQERSGEVSIYTGGFSHQDAKRFLLPYLTHRLFADTPSLAMIASFLPLCSQDKFKKMCVPPLGEAEDSIVLCTTLHCMKRECEKAKECLLEGIRQATGQAEQDYFKQKARDYLQFLFDLVDYVAKNKTSLLYECVKSNK